MLGWGSVEVGAPGGLPDEAVGDDRGRLNDDVDGDDAPPEPQGPLADEGLGQVEGAVREVQRHGRRDDVHGVRAEDPPVQTRQTAEVLRVEAPRAENDQEAGHRAGDAGRVVHGGQGGA